MTDLTVKALQELGHSVSLLWVGLPSKLGVLVAAVVAACYLGAPRRRHLV
jgi:hypothetical protein